MGTEDTGTTTAPTLQREVCDKCGSRMELESSAYGFERWKCPKCQQVVASTVTPRSATASRSSAASRGTTPPTPSGTD